MEISRLKVVFVAGGGIIAVGTITWIYYRRYKQTCAVAEPNLEDNEREVERTAEEDRLHNQLQIFLNDEIGDRPEYRYDSIQYIAGGEIGRAEAASCTDFGQLFRKLETKGKVSRGNYDFLVQKILQPAGYNNTEVIRCIYQFQEHIRACSSQLSENPIPALQDVPRGPAMCDGVILFADTELSREAAVEFIRDAGRVVQDVKIEVIDSLGLGNLTGFDAMQRVQEECWYVFVLMNSDFKTNTFTKFQIQMCLADFLEKNERRVVPVWTESSSDGRIRYPRELTLLGGVKYYMKKMAGNNRQMYEHIYNRSLTSLIEKGRRKRGQVRGEFE